MKRTAEETKALIREDHIRFANKFADVYGVSEESREQVKGIFLDQLDSPMPKPPKHGFWGRLGRMFRKENKE